MTEGKEEKQMMNEFEEKPCDTIEPKEEKEEVKECEHEWYGKRYCRKCGQIEMWGKITGNQAIDLENKMIIGEIITPTPNEWIENKMKEFHDKLKEHDESLCDTNMFIQPYKVEQFLKSSLTQQKEAIEKEWRKKIEQRIEIAKLCIDASAEGQDLGGGFTPKEELESETAIKVALEQLSQ